MSTLSPHRVDVGSSHIGQQRPGRTVLLALLLAGCASLPRINPDMAMRPPHRAAVVGAHGPLSARQSEALLARLGPDGGARDELRRHMALEQAIDGAPLVAGNQVDLLIDGPRTYASMFTAIAGAQDHVNMETFILEPDEIGRRFVDALLERQHAGVQVNLIYDSVGSLATPRTFFQPLVDAGAHVIEYNPINPLNARRGWALNERDHRKLLVVDGRVAYVGGVNISSVYTSGSMSGGASGREHEAPPRNAGARMAWRDTHLRLAGPVVAEFQKLFMATWRKQNGPEIARGAYFPALERAGPAVVRAIGSDPADADSPIYVDLVTAINGASERIWLTNAYFVPDPQLLAALKSASARGVDVRLLLPGRSDSDLVFYAARSYYQELLDTGVRLYERRDTMLHAKTAVIDGVWSTVGSTNLDWRSFLNNQEIVAVMLGAEFGARMEEMYRTDLDASGLITADSWRRRPLLLRLKEAGARLWARLL